MNMPTLEQVIPIILKAGKLLVERKGVDHIKEKAASDFVTELDFAVQNTICSQLAQSWPEIQFMGEEKDNSDIDFTHPYWVLDPVDGTTNLIHDFNHSVISLALVIDHEPQFGAIFNPYHNELFTAKKGSGAFLNGEPIHVSSAPSLSQALNFVGTAPYRRDQVDESFTRIKRVYLASHDVRRFGCTALELCYLACGRADGMFEYGVKPWDIAAGILILSEAGGEAKCVNGGKLPLDRETEIVATNGNFTEELRSIL